MLTLDTDGRDGKTQSYGGAISDAVVGGDHLYHELL